MVKKGLWILSLSVLLLSGCSPLHATRSISRAQKALAAAEAVGARDKCPYEFKAAEMNLEYARSREGVSEFEAAFTFADVSFKLAEKARLKSAFVADGEKARLDAEDIE